MAQAPAPLAPRHLAQVCRAFPQVGFEAYHQDEVFTFRANEVTRHHLDPVPPHRGAPWAIEAMPVPWIKVILQHPDPGMLQQVQTYVRTQWPEDYDVTFSNPYLLEVTAKGGQQGPVGAVGGQPPPGEAAGHYCVGNGLNDIPMLQVSAPVLRPGQQLPRRPGGGGCGPPLLRRELRGGDDPPAGGPVPRHPPDP